MQTITINGKRYEFHTLKIDPDKRTGLTCCCYECDIGMDNIEICNKIDCMSEGIFKYLKEIK